MARVSRRAGSDQYAVIRPALVMSDNLPVSWRPLIPTCPDALSIASSMCLHSRVLRPIYTRPMRAAGTASLRCGQGKGPPEGRARAHDTVDADVPAMALHELARDIEAEPQPAV